MTNGSVLTVLSEGTVHLHHFSKIKSHKEVGNKGFSYYFCLMIEGSGSLSLINGSGSGRPKNIRIRGAPLSQPEFLLKEIKDDI
jgi:hypothetical protein